MFTFRGGIEDRVSALENKAWNTLHTKVSPSTVTLASLQTDKYYLYEVIVHIGGSDYYSSTCFFSNVKNTLRKRIYTADGWYADLYFNLWSATAPVSAKGYNNSGAEQAGTTVTINAREK